MFEKLRLVISRILVFILVAVILVSSSALDDKWPLLSTLLFFCGVVMVAVACLGRLWCSLYIAGYKTDVLIDQGPYSMCRNPLYFFSLVGAVGVGLATETVFIPAIILIAYGAYYPMVIKSEERRLSAIHRDAFIEYFKSTPRFFPAISRLVEPETYVVKPRVYRRHMLDVIWFILIIGFLKVIGVLHELQILPTLFNVY